ncbi:TolC family protein [Geomonas diazotrophica]|uniref:TolC family protein n=1 Tax=Geomonas diazotrophica TaxID=2843197 RepID=UPI001EEFBC19|nr:TolC family protein [Geomonas nitrogeniifigens]
MNHRFLPLIALLMASCAAPAFGEVVTLPEAVKRALQSNHLLKAASLERGAAEQDVAVSRSRYLPRVALESGAVLSNTPSAVFMMKLDEGRINPGKDFAADTLNNPSPRGDFKTALTLEQPLIDFGISTGVALAGKGSEAAALSEEARREEIAFRVYLAYLGVRKAQAYREVADQALLNAREHDRLAAVREKDGIGLKSDRLRTATLVAEAEQRAISAKNDLLLARLRLNLVVGGAQGEPLDVGELPSLAEPAQELEQLIALARLNRPDLKLAENSEQRGELVVRQARNAYLPTLYARGSYQINDRDLPLGTDKDSWTVGVNLRWDLFDGGRRSHEKEKAELIRKSAAELLENERREVALQVTESVLHRQEARLKLASAQSAVRDAEESRRLVTLRFGNGLSSLVEVMDAESALTQARANLVEVDNGFHAATGEIYFRAGVFVKEVLQ